MSPTNLLSHNFKRIWLPLAPLLMLTGCQGLPTVPLCPAPKPMPDLVKQPAPSQNQLTLMKARIERFETSFSPAQQ